MDPRKVLTATSRCERRTPRGIAARPRLGERCACAQGRDAEASVRRPRTRTGRLSSTPAAHSGSCRDRTRACDASRCQLGVEPAGVSGRSRGRDTRARPCFARVQKPGVNSPCRKPVRCAKAPATIACAACVLPRGVRGKVRRGSPWPRARAHRRAPRRTSGCAFFRARGTRRTGPSSSASRSCRFPPVRSIAQQFAGEASGPHARARGVGIARHVGRAWGPRAAIPLEPPRRSFTSVHCAPARRRARVCDCSPYTPAQ